ncbi:MAG: DUF134 domain-containing protein [Spirochaetia bacterium]|nr:DUF134 domain-containing protein [Spirochaetia bacterium]
MQRRVRSCSPTYTVFKPAFTPVKKLEKIVMTLDELEALCLMDSEGLYQKEAAEKMGVSRQTFGNILISARKKSTEMLIKGRLLVVEGGNVCCCHNKEDGNPCCCERNNCCC